MIHGPQSHSNKTSILLFATVFIIALVGGSLGTLFTMRFSKTSQNDLIADYYATENAVHVSPHSLRKDISQGKDTFVLVDLRSQEEYEKEHIIGAVNIPAYKDKDTSDYGAVDRIVSSFQELKSENPGKNIIVYCYSTPCMTGRKVGAMLADKGIYAKHLGIGWNEWRYQWNAWNHEHEWNITDVENYIAQGSEPGFYNGTNYTKGCPAVGGFGC